MQGVVTIFRSDYSMAILDLNTLAQASGEMNSTVSNAIENLETFIRQNEQIWVDPRLYFYAFLPLVFLLVGIFLYNLYFYKNYTKPFLDLEAFAQNLARGNLNVNLPFEKNNYFGKFTWAFDSMRQELIATKERERVSVENNKLIISTLSHDIKTPVATMRACAEALQGDFTTTQKQKEKYLNMLIVKADEIAKLTDDLFIHAVHQLEEMDLDIKSINLAFFLRKMIDLNLNLYELEMDTASWPNVYIQVDPSRLEQIIENLLSNAKKYAKTPVQLDLREENQTAIIALQDFGPGIPPEDIAFVYNKFYRARNSKGQDGAGLGLFIVSELSKKMGGKVNLINNSKGLLVEIIFPIISNS